MCQNATARLSCTPSSVRSARSFVAAHLDAWGVTAGDVANRRVPDAVLVVSELVANAVRASSTEFEVQLAAHRDRIEIAVTDDNPHPAELKRPGPLAGGGRGLLVVDALAERWGQQRQGGHKTVWAHLSLPHGSILARGCTLADD